jgi:hypothetical protein
MRQVWSSYPEARVIIGGYMDSDVFAAVRADGTGVDFAMHNKGVTPIFSYTEMPDEVASKEAGAPVMRAIETVTIMIAGDLLSAASHPVDEAIKARFPEAYKSWKAQQGGYVDGTPLKNWPLMANLPSRIRELENVNIWSVEDLASVAETNLTNITEGRALRDKAREHLSKDSSQSREISELREELAKVREFMSLMGTREPPRAKVRAAGKGWPKGKPRKPKIEIADAVS